MFNILKRKGLLRGKVMLVGLPDHKMFSVSATLFRVPNASSPPPYDGYPPPDKCVDTIWVKEAKDPEDRPLEFQVQRLGGFYYIDVGVIAYLEREGKIYAQVEHFFPQDSPCTIEPGLEREVQLTVNWPDIPFEELHHYGTVRPQRQNRIDAQPEAAIAIDYGNRGWAYHSEGNYDKALEYFQKALEIELKIWGSEHSTVAIRYGNIGETYFNKGDNDRAIEYFQKALQINLKKLGPEHPDTAIDYSNIGSVYNSKRDYDKALEYYQKAFEIQLKALGADDPKVAIRYNNIGTVYEAKGNYDKALEYYKNALEIELKIMGPEYPNLANRYSNIATAFKHKGDYHKALAYYEKALEISIMAFGPEHPKTKLIESHLNSLE